MLKKWTLPFALVAMLWVGCLSAAEVATSKVQWMSNYQQGMQQAQQSGKPLLVLFTGSDWCSWCKKLEQEILSRPEFEQSLANRFVFVKLDFPLYKTGDPAETERNKTIQKQFDVQGFPTIVIVSANGQKIGSAGYQPMSPKAYADHLLQIARQ